MSPDDIGGLQGRWLGATSTVAVTQPEQLPSSSNRVEAREPTADEPTGKQVRSG
jgi:hypothetical protein